MTDVAERIEQKIDRDVTGSLAVIGTGGATNIAPRNMGELMEFAKLMALSGPCIRPAFRHNPGACLALSLQAFRWGMDPIAVSNKAYITKNKSGEEQIAFEAQLVHAVVNERAPLARRLRPTYTGEGAKRRCEIQGWLKGEEASLDYKSPEIANIPVQNSPLWKSDPDQQLFYYSVRAWARRHVPEVLLGVYTPEEIDAQEAHYGPDNAVDVTPPRPKRADFVKKTEPIDIVDQHGETVSFQDEREAAETLSMHMHEAAKARSAEGAAGVWESNAIAVTTLRERGFDGLANSLLKEYDELTKPPAPEPESKAREIPGKKSNKSMIAGTAHLPRADVDDLLGPKVGEPAPRSPLVGQYSWEPWIEWFLAALRTLPGDQIAHFIAAHSKEYDYMAEHRPETISEADRIIEGRKKA